MKRNKLWVGISAAALAGMTGLTGCASGEGEGEHSYLAGSGHHGQSHSLGGEGEGEGEGENEGEGVAKVNFLKDDVAYLTQLGLMRGHLLVGYQLFKDGHIEHAKTHMKHPKSELYSDVASAFEARNVAGFADQLSALSSAVEQEQASEVVDTAYAELLNAISVSEAAVDSSTLTPGVQLQRVVALLRVAGEEYAIAVVDGEMKNAHEYQDALGFTTVAAEIIDSISGADAVQAKAQDIVESLKPLWPNLVPPATLTTEAGQLFGAAAKIELLALSL